MKSSFLDENAVFELSKDVTTPCEDSRRLPNIISSIMLTMTETESISSFKTIDLGTTGKPGNSVIEDG
jgi:hypothetical protein